MKVLNILLVDDHKIVRDGIRYSLELSKHLNVEIEEAETGLEAVTLTKLRRYDVIIMDINMPDMDGVEATKQILKIRKSAKILALSMHEEEFQIISMAKAGARGYILKNTGTEELCKAIQTISKGEKYFSNEVMIKLVGHYYEDLVERKPRAAKSYKGLLTKREVEILKLVANEFTNEEIGKKLFIAKRTVDAHRQNIMNKTGVKNTAGLIKYAMQNNLI
ncbi:MAG: response regulator transcription factor [Flavobacteriales bacterium]|nr:response regulator transcription factor [Flavobacteriales bacterium]